MITYIIARKCIISAATGKRLTDADLARCNGIKIGPCHEVKFINNGLKEELIAEFQKLNPTFHKADYEMKIER